nr:hypothetical protein BaRGS_025932 [Batillaria attramentaria]
MPQQEQPQPRQEKSHESHHRPQTQAHPAESQQTGPSENPTTASPESNLKKSDSALSSLLQNFENVYYSDDGFLHLTIDEVCDLLSSDHLNVADEKIAFFAVCRWIDYSPKKRKVHVARLLKTIRMGLLSTEFFVQTVLPHAYVRTDKAAREIARDTLRFLNDSDLHPMEEVDFDNPIARPRVPRDVLFVIGGWSGDSPTNIMEAYDTRADTWTVCGTPDTIPRAYHAAAALGTNIYIVGGFDGTKCLSSCRMFDPLSKTWNKAGRMHHRRCYVCVAVLQGYIYAMGGYDGEVWKKSVERYDPAQLQWQRVRPMNHARSDAGATTLDDKIYICGGFDGTGCLDSAEVYNPVSGQWTLIAPMPKRRSGVGVMAYHGCVYVLGGFNGNARKSTGKRYNPKTKEWTRVPEMYTPRSNFATALSTTSCSPSEVTAGTVLSRPLSVTISRRMNGWTPTDMSVNRSALSACVVSGLPNVQDYIYRRPLMENIRPVSPSNPSTSEAPPAFPCSSRAYLRSVRFWGQQSLMWVA